MKFRSRLFRFGILISAVALITIPGTPSVAQQAPTPANSQGSATLSVSPAIFDETLSAGASFTTTVTLSNVSSNPLAIHASASSLVPDQKLDPSYKEAYDASPWFKLSTPDFLLLPNQQQTEVVTVSVPVSAESGGHYATVYFESFAQTPPQDVMSTAINPRVGVLALLTVRGNIREHAEPSGPIAVQGFQAEAGPTSLDLAIKNDGNVHLLPYGTLTITNVFGSKVKTMPLPLGTLLPGTTRDYGFSWEHGLRFGIYKASATVTVGAERTKLVPETKRFILFPLIAAVPILVLVLFVVILLIWRHRRVKRRRLRRQQAANEPVGRHAAGNRVVLNSLVSESDRDPEASGTSE